MTKSSPLKSYLVEISHPEAPLIQLLVPAIGQSSAKRIVIQRHMTARKVEGVEALDLVAKGVPVLTADDVPVNVPASEP